MTKNNPFSVRLKEDVLQCITQYANENERSISWVINKALEQFLSIEPSPAPQQIKQAPQKRDVSASKEQKVSTPQPKKESPAKEPKTSEREQRQLSYLQQRIKDLEKGK